MSANFHHRRKEPRIPIRPLHHISFEWRHEGKEIPLAISNVSTKGIGFLKDTSYELPNSGIIEGVLKVSDQQFVIHPEIVFANDSAVGCQITDPTPDSDAAIQKYFEVELLALNLKEDPDPPYETDPPLVLKVWGGQNNCEVLVVINGEKLQRYKLTVFGNVFDGGADRDFIIGEIIRNQGFDDFTDGGRMTLTKNRSEIDNTTKEAAMRFISALEEVSDEHRQLMHQQLMSFPLAQS